MFHLNAIEASGVIDLVSIADKSDNQLRDVGKSTGVGHSCSDYHDLLARPDVEAVAINTPPKVHEEMTLEALDAGKHVLCEKPLSQTIEGCMKIRDKQSESGLTVLPAHNYIYSPCLNEIQEKLKGGLIGEVSRIDIVFENFLQGYGSKTDFRTTDPRGIVEDIMPHALSVATMLFGHPEKVLGVSGSCQKYKVCDNVSASLETSSGVELSCTGSWTKLIPHFRVMIEGSLGNISTDLALNPYSYSITVNGQKETFKDRGFDWYLDLVRFKHPSFSEQYRHFHRVVKDKEPQKFTIDDELSMIRVIQNLGLEVEKVTF